MFVGTITGAAAGALAVEPGESVGCGDAVQAHSTAVAAITTNPNGR
jgi:hypothetical protein